MLGEETLVHSQSQQGANMERVADRGGTCFVVIFFCILFGVKILNIILYTLRCGVYACVRRWGACVRPRGT